MTLVTLFVGHFYSIVFEIWLRLEMYVIKMISFKILKNVSTRQVVYTEDPFSTRVPSFLSYHVAIL